jgi:hypothetical protein
MTADEYELLVAIANVFASYKVEPHDEGVPIQEVVDHLIRSIGWQLPDEDTDWFTDRAGLGRMLWRFDHEAHAAGQEMTD